MSLNGSYVVKLVVSLITSESVIRYVLLSDRVVALIPRIVTQTITCAISLGFFTVVLPSHCFRRQLTEQLFVIPAELTEMFESVGKRNLLDQHIVCIDVA
jgi:hypothetical protein